MAGSTKEILDYAQSEQGPIILATERGVYDSLRLKYPRREFYQVCPDRMTCADMKKTTLRQVYDALTGRGGEVIVLDEALRRQALNSITNMLKYGS